MACFDERVQTGRISEGGLGSLCPALMIFSKHAAIADGRFRRSRGCPHFSTSQPSSENELAGIGTLLRQYIDVMLLLS
jgi:hypothetical protein